MSAAPKWLDEIVNEFGRSAGIQSLMLGERGIAALNGDDGLRFTLEYVYPNLMLCMTTNVTKDVETAKKVLTLSAPLRRDRFGVRTGFMPRESKAFFAVRLPQDSVTQPMLADVFRELRRMAERFVGGIA